MHIRNQQSRGYRWRDSHTKLNNTPKLRPGKGRGPIYAEVLSVVAKSRGLVYCSDVSPDSLISAVPVEESLKLGVGEVIGFL